MIHTVLLLSKGFFLRSVLAVTDIVCTNKTSRNRVLTIFDFVFGIWSLEIEVAKLTVEFYRVSLKVQECKSQQAGWLAGWQNEVRITICVSFVKYK